MIKVRSPVNIPLPEPSIYPPHLALHDRIPLAMLLRDTDVVVPVRPCLLPNPRKMIQLRTSQNPRRRKPLRPNLLHQKLRLQRNPLLRVHGRLVAPPKALQMAHSIAKSASSHGHLSARRYAIGHQGRKRSRPCLATSCWADRHQAVSGGRV